MTISYSQLGKNGRLANQIFEAASTIGIAKDNGADAVFPAWPYERYFANPLPHGLMNPNMVHERGYEFNEIKTTESIDLGGYFQSPKYWANHQAEIFKQFTFRKDFYDFFKTRHKLAHIFDREVVAIHVRRGDYVGNENYVNLPKEYYTGALEQYFPDIHKMNILVFSDDIPYAQEMLAGIKNTFFSTDNSEIDDLCMMSQCSHWIIANSSFSWWAAYLGNQSGSARVVRPAHYFSGPLAERASIVDLYPETWYVYDHLKKDEPVTTLQDKISDAHSNFIIAATETTAESYDGKKAAISSIESDPTTVEKIPNAKTAPKKKSEPKPKKKNAKPK